MSVSNGQPANETTFNDAFPSRTDDSSVSGLFSFLNTTESTSPTTGAVKLSGGLGVAKNLNVGGVFLASQISGSVKSYSAQTVSDDDAISYEASQSIQFRRVIGNAGNSSVNNLPFGADPTSLVDAAIFIVIGTDDTDTVTFSHNDAQYGAMLFGNATLKKGYILALIWDAIQERFFEITRNF